MPSLDRVLETALYVDDLGRAAAFYVDVLGLAALYQDGRLHARGVAIEGRVDWPRGGRSVYFRDPDGHLLEFATPGQWSIY